MDPLEKQLDPLGPIASQGGSVPVNLRKPIANWDFPMVGLNSPIWIHACRAVDNYWQKDVCSARAETVILSTKDNLIV